MTLCIHTARVEATIHKILQKIDRRTGKFREYSKGNLGKDECAVVVLKFNKVISCEVFSEIPSLGRFLIKQPMRAVGIVIRIHEE